MRQGRLRGDLSLLRQGIDVAVGFGVASLEGLVGAAELLETSVYERGSLARTAEGVTFTLLNPPLRMGAFGAASVRWNGLELPPSSVSVRFANGSPTVRLDELTRSTPLVLPVGVRSTFDLRGVEVGAGPQRVRLDLHSVAIPPRVWFEFSEEVRPVEVRA